jgi:hypothetical protein
MEPDKLRRELEARGLELLGVGRHHSSPDILIVYLHGNAGQWRDGAARNLIGSVPGVITVSESVHSASILLARVETTDADDDAHLDGEDRKSDEEGTR